MSKRHLVWAEAFKEELKVVESRHSGDQPTADNLVGLAFSGGGIRSATFGLGVLEGLKKLGLLTKIDYLSTVSGGGYIGAWLSANCKRAAERAPASNWLDENANWDDSIGHLRRYSNYLSPKLGFFSADTWSMATIWLRNTLLVQITVILAIAVALLAPRPLFVAFEKWPGVGDWRWTTIFLFIFGVIGIAGNLWRLNHVDAPLLELRNWRKGLSIAAVCLALAWIIGAFRSFDPFTPGQIDYLAAGPIAILLVAAGFYLQPVAVKIVHAFWPGRNAPEQINYTQPWVQYAVVIPMLAVGFLVAAILWDQTLMGKLSDKETYGDFFKAAWQYWPFPLTVVFASLLLLSFCSLRNKRGRFLWSILVSIPAMLVLHALLSAIMLLLHAWAMKGSKGHLWAYIWTPSMVLYAFALTVVILIGMLGRESSEGVREWWSRFGAWLGIYGVAWMVINVAATYGPVWTAILFDGRWGQGLSIGWVGSTMAGLFAGKSANTSGRPDKSTVAKVLEVVAQVAPYIFIAGLLVAVSTVLHLIIAINSGSPASGDAADRWNQLYGANFWVTLLVLLGCLVSLLLFAARVDINEFGLNAFYRSRLVRCYLGATRFLRGERNPQNFTGFDDADDLKLGTLAEPVDASAKPAGPLHIINCALNLGGSSDLSLHTRHSATFTLTPLHCGSHYPSREPNGNTVETGYTPTTIYGGREGQPKLGQAISVSGAAASPNMGYHTSPVVAFLLTLFDVRLGWWFPNPRKTGVDTPSPSFSLRYLFMELFGGADDKSKYLAISDGGHFENLAAYELVKRRCRVIIISDAECDPKLQFEGLGTLIRMCDVDFHAKIKIDVGSIRPAEDLPWSNSRCSVGTIRYSDGSVGTLIYLKASMTGHENTSILQYKASHETFPHESTGNQFYREDQFESYRALGCDIATKTFEPVAAEQSVVAMADRLEKICSPTLPTTRQFTQNSTRLMDLWSRLGGNGAFESLDRELANLLPSQASLDFRSGFYLCIEMIQLMENVYLDLQLEDTWGHPDNQGWRVLFENWSRSPTLQKTWALTSKTFGLRFQYFCQRYLNLPL